MINSVNFTQSSFAAWF